MRKPILRKPRSGDLWINPKSNLRGVDGNRAWENEGNITPSTGSRMLELADIALGNIKPQKRRKGHVHVTGNKTEPHAG